MVDNKIYPLSNSELRGAPQLSRTLGTIGIHMAQHELDEMFNAIRSFDGKNRLVEVSAQGPVEAQIEGIKAYVKSSGLMPIDQYYGVEAIIQLFNRYKQAAERTISEPMRIPAASVLVLRKFISQSVLEHLLKQKFYYDDLIAECPYGSQVPAAFSENPALGQKAIADFIANGFISASLHGPDISRLYEQLIYQGIESWDKHRLTVPVHWHSRLQDPTSVSQTFVRQDSRRALRPENLQLVDEAHLALTVNTAPAYTKEQYWQLVSDLLVARDRFLETYKRSLVKGSGFPSAHFLEHHSTHSVLWSTNRHLIKNKQLVFVTFFRVNIEQYFLSGR